jgi:hypothetical protein
MTTILIFNAVSSLLAAIAVGGYLTWEDQRTRRRTAVVPIYVTTTVPRPRR